MLGAIQLLRNEMECGVGIRISADERHEDA